MNECYSISLNSLSKLIMWLKHNCTVQSNTRKM